MCLVEPEVNWRSTTLVFLGPVTFSQGSCKHKKGLDCAFFFFFQKGSEAQVNDRKQNVRSRKCEKKLKM